MKLEVWTQKDIPAMAKLDKERRQNPWSKQTFETSFAQAHTHGLVYRSKHQLCGFIVYRVVVPEMEILDICVSKQFEGKGIGKNLLLAAQAHGKKLGASKSFLEVRKSNVRAIGLYEQNQYRHQAIRKAYYSDNEDAFTMTLTL